MKNSKNSHFSDTGQHMSKKTEHRPVHCGCALETASSKLLKQRLIETLRPDKSNGRDHPGCFSEIFSS